MMLKQPGQNALAEILRRLYRYPQPGGDVVTVDQALHATAGREASRVSDSVRMKDPDVILGRPHHRGKNAP